MPARAKLEFVGDNRTKRAFSEINAGIGKLKGAAGALGSAFKGVAGILAGGALLAAGKNALDAADKIQKLSIKTKASTEFLSAMKFAAEQSGIGFESLATGIDKMLVNVSKAADGTGEAKKAIAELGLSAKRLEELAPEEQFDVLAESLSKVKNSGDRARIAMAIFGEAGVQLLQAMEGGADGVRALRDEAAGLGVVLSREATDKAAAANDAFNRMKSAVNGVVQEMAINMAPALTKIANFMANDLSKVLHAVRHAFFNLASGAAKALASMLEGIRTWVANITKALEVLYLPGSGVLHQVTDALGGWTAGLEEFGAASDVAAAQAGNLVIGVERVTAAAEQGRKAVAELTAAVAGADPDNPKAAKGRKPPTIRPKITISKKDAKDNELTNGLREGVADALITGVQEGGKGMKEQFRALLADLAVQLLKSQLLKLLANFGGGLFGGGDAAAGGTRQAGGAVSGGRAYQVHQDEVFVPNSAGIIYPARLGGGGASVVYQIDARGADAGVADRIRAAIADSQTATIAKVRDMRRRGAL